MIQVRLSAAALSFVLIALPAAAKQNAGDMVPQRFVGTYAFEGQTDTVSGPFGSLSCTDFQQFSPDLVCEGISILALRADGTAQTTIAGQAPLSESFGTWRRTGRRAIEIQWIALVYDANGIATNWALQTTRATFDSSRTQVNTEFEINWYPIDDDPRNPVSAPDITFIGGGEGRRFDPVG